VTTDKYNVYHCATFHGTHNIRRMSSVGRTHTNYHKNCSLQTHSLLLHILSCKPGLQLLATVWHMEQSWQRWGESTRYFTTHLSKRRYYV